MSSVSRTILWEMVSNALLHILSLIHQGCTLSQKKIWSVKQDLPSINPCWAWSCVLYCMMTLRVICSMTFLSTEVRQAGLDPSSVPSCRWGSHLLTSTQLLDNWWKMAHWALPPGTSVTLGWMLCGLIDLQVSKWYRSLLMFFPIDY